MPWRRPARSPGETRPCPTSRRRPGFRSCRRPGDVTELAEVLLCSCEGVCRAWAVSVDGNFLGWAEDISALSESMEGVIGSQIPYTATRAGFDAEISIEPAAIPSGWETDIDELSGAVRKLARVFYETPDGALRYA